MKGVVMEVDKGRAVLLCTDGVFREVTNRGYAQGQSVVVSRPAYRRFLAVAASLLLLISTGFGGYQLWYTPTSYIYMDINPSLRLELNLFDRVIAVTALNADAEQLLAQADIKKGDATECMDSIVMACQQQEYLNETNTDVEINVYSEHTAVNTSVQAVVEEMTQTDLTVNVYELDNSENSDALALQLSGRSLRAIETYTQYFGGDVAGNAHLLDSYSADEIFALVQQYRRSTPGSDAPAAIPQAESIETPPREQALPQQEAPAQFDESAAKRQRAIAAYTQYVGGDEEENARLLAGYSADEIVAMVQQYRRSAAGNDDSAAVITQPESIEAPPQQEVPAQFDESAAKRQRAIETYTQYFGGTEEENAELLRQLSADEIFAIVREYRRSTKLSD